MAKFTQLVSGGNGIRGKLLTPESTFLITSMKIDSFVCSIIPIIVLGIVDICISIQLMLVMHLIFVGTRILGSGQYEYRYINDIDLTFKQLRLQRERQR